MTAFDPRQTPRARVVEVVLWTAIGTLSMTVLVLALTWFGAG